MSTGKEPAYAPQQTGYWTNRKWFTLVASFLVFWIALYLFTHWDRVYSGYKHSRFSIQQIQQINKILYNDNTIAENKVNSAPVAIMEYDTLKHDSIISVSRPVTENRISASDIYADSYHINKAMIYIRSEYDNKINENQLNITKQYISSFGSQDVSLFLANLKVKVKSYFWLTGPAVYLEIVFWVIIGVICSILFSIGSAGRNETAAATPFNENEILYQIAKIFYAPFCSIIMVLGYNYIKHRNVIEVNTNEGMLVFSFVTGLFSGRLMSLFERFKDVLLPEHTVKAVNTGSYSNNVHYNGIGAIIPPATQNIAHANIPFAEENEYISDVAEAMPENIKEVTIVLKLDAGGLFEEEKDELLDNGFTAAIVTLHNVNGKDVITLGYTTYNSEHTFVADNVKPGIYIARATMTQKLSDNYVVNLFVEKTVYITHENNSIELFIKRYETID